MTQNTQDTFVTYSQGWCPICKRMDADIENFYEREEHETNNPFSIRSVFIRSVLKKINCISCKRDQQTNKGLS